MLRTFFSSQKGQGLVEYVIVLTAIAMLLMGSFTLLNDIPSPTALLSAAAQQPIALIVLLLAFVAAVVSNIKECNTVSERVR